MRRAMSSVEPITKNYVPKRTHSIPCMDEWDHEATALPVRICRRRRHI